MVLHNRVLPIEFKIIAPLCLRLYLEMVLLQYGTYNFFFYENEFYN